MSQDPSRPGAATLPPECFSACPDDPVLDPSTQGIRIWTRGLLGSPQQPAWHLHGALRLPRTFAGPIPEELFSRIVVVLRGATSETIQARHAFRHELAFPEDVVDEGATVRAAFHIDLLRLFDFETQADTYFIEACLGPHVSNTLTCPTQMSWLPAPWQTVDWHSPPSTR